jgi:hypothetical protein
LLIQEGGFSSASTDFLPPSLLCELAYLCVVAFTVQNSETVAQELQELSNGKIRTGVYHADRQESEKYQLHAAWRDGKIKVVCATIGMFFPSMFVCLRLMNPSMCFGSFWFGY